MQRLIIVLSLCLLTSNINGRILIPEEISTILSLVYSVIPPVKIGKDSRFGVGFRVGPNIDYQLIVELGPQTNTQPLGQTGSKRNVPQRTKKYEPANITTTEESLMSNTTNGQAPEKLKLANE